VKQYIAPTFDVNLDPAALVIDLTSLYAAFARLTDQRDARGLRYGLPTLLTFMTLAKLAGENTLAGIADWVIEFPVDTTRTIASLLFSGTVARCPRIRFVFAHLGGILPLVVSHLSRAVEVDAQLASRTGGNILEMLETFHYDTALRANPGALKAALELINVRRILFGTDAPLRRSADQLQGLLEHGFSAADLRAIECENARKLLTRSAR
jgi:predicted TIM-barrel fold metal-dependent hydrolase